MRSTKTTKTTKKSSLRKSKTSKSSGKTDRDIYLIDFLKKIRNGDPLKFSKGILRQGMKSFHSKNSYKRFNLYNLWIITMARSSQELETSPFWITFPAIKREGGMIKKGSRGVKIWSPVIREQINEETGEKESVLAFFKTQTVFNLSDTTGIEHPKEESRAVVVNEEIESFLFVPIVRNLGASFHYTEHYDHISMPPQKDVDSDKNYYQVLLHELTHATGVKSRLNRSCFNNYQKSPEERAKEEFVAEFGSYLLGKEFGIIDQRQEEKTLAYLSSWGKEIDDKQAIEALKQSFDAVETILSRKWFKEGKFTPAGKAQSTIAAKSL